MPTKKHPTFPRAAGFTLIELLTVIAIIGVLAAIIIPTVGRVRQTAKSSVCKSNLRQFGMASALYMNDNRDRLNYQTTSSSLPFWQYRLEPYISKANVRNDGTIWLCPEVQDGDRTLVTDVNKKDYAMSAETLKNVTDSRNGVSPQPFTLADFPNPSRKVYIADVDPTRNTTLITTSEFYAGTGGKLKLRHGDKANVLFLDGHVQSLGMPPLPEKKNAVLGAQWLAADTAPAEF